MLDRAIERGVKLLLSFPAQSKPGPHHESSGAVAGNIDFFPVKDPDIVVVELVGKILKRGLVIHARIVEDINVLFLVQSLINEIIPQLVEADRPVRVSMNN